MQRLSHVLIILMLLVTSLHAVTIADSLQIALDSLQVTIISAREASDSLAIPILMQQRGALANQLSFMQLDTHAPLTVSYGNIALESAIAAGDTMLAAQAHLNIGSGYLKLEDYRNAAEHFHEALGIYTRQDDRYGQCLSLNFLGVIFRELENFPKSEDYFRRSLEAAGEDKRIRIRIYTNLGNLYLKQKFFDEAVRSFEEAYYLSEELGMPLEAVNSRIRIAAVYHESGELNRAYSAYRLILQQDDVPQKADILNRIGKVLMDRKDYDQALEYLNKSQESYRTQADTLHMLSVMQNLAETHRELLHFSQAIALYSDLLTIAQQRSLDRLQADAMLGMVLVYRSKGDATNAGKIIDRFFKEFDTRLYPAVTLEMLKVITQLHYDKNDLRKAFETQQQYIDYLDHVNRSENRKQIEELKVRYETELIDYRQEIEHQRQQKEQLVEQWDDREKKVHQLKIQVENLEEELKECNVEKALIEEQARMDRESHKKNVIFLSITGAGILILAGLMLWFWLRSK